MGWKEWPMWVKGGVIFLIFPIIGLYGLLTCEEYSCIIYLPFAGGILFFEDGDSPLFHVVNFIFYFVIGALIGCISALIGWIVGKIRARKQEH